MNPHPLSLSQREREVFFDKIVSLSSWERDEGIE